MIYAIAAAALTVLMGWMGRPSIMTAAMLLAGGYCDVVYDNVLHLPFVVVLLLTLLTGVVFGTIASIPARRLGGLYLLLSTLAIFFIVTDLGNEFQTKKNALSGYSLATPDFFGFDLNSDTRWVWFTGILAILVLEYLRYIRRGRIGRAWIAVRDHEDMASVAGIKIQNVVMVGFALTTAVQFLAGGLLGYFLGHVSYDSVDLLLSINFIVMIVLGGMGSLYGAVIGTAIVTGLPVFMNSAFGASSSTSWLSQQLVPLESIAFALIGVFVLLGLPQTIWTRLRTVLHPQSSAPPSEPEQGPAPDDMILSGERLSVRYHAGEHALENVSISVAERSATAVLGRNGAGKTSLLYALAGFPRTSGGKLIRGMVRMTTPQGQLLDLTRAGALRRSRFGILMVPAEEKIFPDLTVEEHIREALAAAAKATDGRRRCMPSRSVAQIIENFPTLQGRGSRLAGNLSGGERQQLALAVALTRNPRALLIDEPSLGLSPVAIDAVKTTLSEVSGDPACALVLTEQNPDLIHDLAGMVVLLDAGKVVSAGAPDEEFLRRVEKNFLGIDTDAFGDNPVDPSQTQEPHATSIMETEL